VEKGSHDGFGVLLKKGEGISGVEGMLDVGLPGEAHLPLMGACGVVIGPLYPGLSRWRQVFAGFLEEIEDFHRDMIHQLGKGCKASWNPKEGTI